jgi:hypothetical protein
MGSSERSGHNAKSGNNGSGWRIGDIGRRIGSGWRSRDIGRRIGDIGRRIAGKHQVVQCQCSNFLAAEGKEGLMKGVIHRDGAMTNNDAGRFALISAIKTECIQRRRPNLVPVPAKIVTT